MAAVVDRFQAERIEDLVDEGGDLGARDETLGRVGVEPKHRPQLRP